MWGEESIVQTTRLVFILLNTLVAAICYASLHPLLEVIVTAYGYTVVRIVPDFPEGVGGSVA